jgi:hypothetical protein
MPPELEAKLIAPDEMRLPGLSGLADGATAVRVIGVTPGAQTVLSVPGAIGCPIIGPCRPSAGNHVLTALWLIEARLGAPTRT